MLTPDDVQGFMAARAIDGEILLLDVPTPTVEMAAQAVGTQPQQIVKSLLFLVNSQPVLAITCGTETIDRRAIGAARVAVPHDRGLPLIGDADGGDLVGLEIRLAPRPTHDFLGGLPDLQRVMLHPSRARV